MKSKSCGVATSVGSITYVEGIVGVLVDCTDDGWIFARHACF